MMDMKMNMKKVMIMKIKVNIELFVSIRTGQVIVVEKENFFPKT